MEVPRPLSPHNVTLSHLADLLYTSQLSERPNPALNAIIPFLDAVVGAELEVTLARPFPLEMLDVSFPSEYVTYMGSLTTPPCSEVVTWIVQSRPLALSPQQVR
jgi:carbonic anhydrase